jgi:hypothetical protein
VGRNGARGEKEGRGGARPTRNRPHVNRRPPLRFAASSLTTRSRRRREEDTDREREREREMASSLARLGAALPRARPRAAARVLMPGRWDAAAVGASRRASLNGKQANRFVL